MSLEESQSLLLHYEKVMMEGPLDGALSQQDIHTLSALAIIEDRADVFKKVRFYLTRAGRIPAHCLFYDESLSWPQIRSMRGRYISMALS